MEEGTSPITPKEGIATRSQTRTRSGGRRQAETTPSWASGGRTRSTARSTGQVNSNGRPPRPPSSRKASTPRKPPSRAKRTPTSSGTKTKGPPAKPLTPKTTDSPKTTKREGNRNGYKAPTVDEAVGMRKAFLAGNVTYFSEPHEFAPTGREFRKSSGYSLAEKPHEWEEYSPDLEQCVLYDDIPVLTRDYPDHDNVMLYLVKKHMVPRCMLAEGTSIYAAERLLRKTFNANVYVTASLLPKLFFRKAILAARRNSVLSEQDGNVAEKVAAVEANDGGNEASASTETMSELKAGLLTMANAVTTQAVHWGRVMEAQAEDTKELKASVKENSDRISDAMDHVKRNSDSIVNLGERQVATQRQVDDQGERLTVIEKKLASMEPNELERMTWSARKPWEKLKREQHDEPEAGKKVVRSLKTLFDDADGTNSGVDLGCIAVDAPPNYLYERIKRAIQVAETEPAALSQDHHRHIAEFKEINPRGVDTARKDFEEAGFFIIKDPKNPSMLAEFNSLSQFYAELQGDVLVIPLNDNEAVYITTILCDSTVTGDFLGPAGGGGVRFSLVSGEVDLDVYAPTSKAAAPTVCALLQLASKSVDTSKVDFEGAFMDERNGGPVDLPLEEDSFDKPIRQLKSLEVQRVKVLPGQESLLVSLSNDLQLHKCSVWTEASDDVSIVSSSLVDEFLKATHLRRIEFRDRNILSTQATVKLLEGLEERAKSDSSLVVHFQSVWDTMSNDALTWLANKVRESLEQGLDMSYVHVYYDGVLQGPLKGFLKNAVKTAMANLGKGHPVVTKIVEEGFLPVKIVCEFTRGNEKVASLVKKWASEVASSNHQPSTAGGKSSTPTKRPPTPSSDGNSAQSNHQPSKAGSKRPQVAFANSSVQESPTKRPRSSLDSNV